ncbi:general stress protein 16O [bacterium BMS3Abin05]|nr:general stress protein 16O [bacterium BMS3Abin05]GBE27264.1 general stress protein 16O [bacterium BMS3Bbin03]HDK36036.1 TraR/DksA family transcriptional regulator [Bacteroidota bacterium]HDL78864.1 TraR/DksA family transcriptional regulator [Bacteroidota bacterium]HDZ10843.1 TraR/DksA family transcriptional regulator [Bacteroidota bacterium]
MTKKELEHYKQLLLKKREELLREINYIKENSFKKTMKESSGEISAYNFHMADQGTDTNEREKAFMFAYRENRLIYHIDQALERIKTKTYGNCQECGNPINRERLEAVPHARMCIDCKSKEEQSKKE